MMTDRETLRILNNGTFEHLYGADIIANNVIKNKLSEIPVEYYTPNISIDMDGKTQISLIQFSMETVNLSPEKRNGLMKMYNIDPYDMQKLQSIINGIKVAQEYGNAEKDSEGRIAKSESHEYGFSLASNDKLDKAYPLWLAYLFIDSINPINDIRSKLKEDGMEDKYTPESIIDLMEHTNEIMHGRGEQEKKDFYMKAINDILEDEERSVVSEIEL